MQKSPELHQEENRSHDMNRRELLKVLGAAGGGLAAAAFLPGKWLKPVVEAGVLPAHAQATDTLKLTNLDVWPVQGRSQQSNKCNLDLWSGSAWYEDDLCKVGIDPTQLIGSSPNLENWIVTDGPSGSCNGVFGFDFMACCNEVLSVYLQVGSRQSNTLTDDLLPCVEY